MKEEGHPSSSGRGFYSSCRAAGGRFPRRGFFLFSTGNWAETASDSLDVQRGRPEARVRRGAKEGTRFGDQSAQTDGVRRFSEWDGASVAFRERKGSNTSRGRRAGEMEEQDHLWRHFYGIQSTLQSRRVVRATARMLHVSFSESFLLESCLVLLFFFFLSLSDTCKQLAAAQPPQASNVGGFFWSWLPLLFGEERCCSFIFKVALGPEPYCSCWQEGSPFILVLSFPGKEQKQASVSHSIGNFLAAEAPRKMTNNWIKNPARREILRPWMTLC